MRAIRDYHIGEYQNSPYSFNVAPTTAQMYQAIKTDDYGCKTSITCVAQRKPESFLQGAFMPLLGTVGGGLPRKCFYVKMMSELLVMIGPNLSGLKEKISPIFMAQTMWNHGPGRKLMRRKWLI